jgi:hypothetical protein
VAQILYVQVPALPRQRESLEQPRAEESAHSCQSWTWCVDLPLLAAYAAAFSADRRRAFKPEL